jgi:thioredoxin-dependent peroxiredoxin
MPLTTGIKAPDFKLLDESGAPHDLKEYRGKALVLYFYPKDDTPGCTTEACSFRDNYSAYQKAGVTILGVSADSVASHARFKEKYSLPFTLLADEDHHVCELYGVWGLKKSYGNEHMGVIRTTYVIDKDGDIARVFENVKPSEHSAEVLNAVHALG